MERITMLIMAKDSLIFIIGDILFAYKTIHKLTWTLPCGGTQSQIDQIIINSKWMYSLQDVRVKTEKLGKTASTLGFKDNNKQTQRLRQNTSSNNPVTLNWRQLADATELVHLGSKTTTDCDYDQEINAKISEANSSSFEDLV